MTKERSAYLWSQIQVLIYIPVVLSFSNLSVYPNHLKCLWKTTRSCARFSNSVGLGWCPRISISNSSHKMLILLVLAPYWETTYVYWSHNAHSLHFFLLSEGKGLRTLLLSSDPKPKWQLLGYPTYDSLLQWEPWNVIPSVMKWVSISRYKLCFSTEDYKFFSIAMSFLWLYSFSLARWNPRNLYMHISHHKH